MKQVLIRPGNAELQNYDGEVLADVQTAWPATCTRDAWEAVHAYRANPAPVTPAESVPVPLRSGHAICGRSIRTQDGNCSTQNEDRLLQPVKGLQP